MKKLLSLLGAVSLSASTAANSTIFLSRESQEKEIKRTSDTVDKQQIIKTGLLSNKNLYNYNFLSQQNNFLSFDIEDLQVFESKIKALSQKESNKVQSEIEAIFKIEDYSLAIEEIQRSKNNFIIENKSVIEQSLQNYHLTKTNQDKFSSIQNFFSLTDFNWSQINEVINFGFTDSSDYGVWTGTYGPSAWWKVWEWGWQINFNEGVVNVMRLIFFSFMYFNGKDLNPLKNEVIKIKETIKTFLDYLFNLDKHEKDNLSVLYDLVVDTIKTLKNSKIPFKSAFLAPFKEIERELKTVLDNGIYIYIKILKKWFHIKGEWITIGRAKEQINDSIKDFSDQNLTLEQIQESYYQKLNDLDQIISGINEANKVLNDMYKWTPWIVYQFIIYSIRVVSASFVAADKNKKGVSIRFSNFQYFIGVWPR